MEKLFFKKIELWIVLLLAVLAVVGSIVFAAIVRNKMLGFDRFGAVGDAALALAEIPGTARELLKPDRVMVADTRSDFEGKSGWTFNADAIGDFPGYLLVSRYDGNAKRHIIELLDVPSGKVMQTWRPDADQLLQGAARQSDVVTFERWTRKYFRFISPYLAPNGDLVVKDHQSPLMRVDSCGNLVWRQEGSFFHHATEIGPDGNMWIAGRIEPAVDPAAPPQFRDDSIVKVSMDGEVLYQKSVAEIFVENGLDYLLFGIGLYQDDPIHMNDVQPVLADGPYWKKGDLFLSLRHKAMIVLYRPSTNRIIWKKQGPWAGQHDVDIVNDTTISIFNNNTYRYATNGRGKIDGVNELVYYDFASDTVSRPYQKIFTDNRIATSSEGLSEVLPGGYLLVEEENVGRILLFSPTGALIGEFVNRADNGFVYRLGWSRFISAELGDGVMAKLKNVTCEAPT
jgi:Arylsulfotransferase (ASST)